jgi:hypothetical protein
VSQHFSQLKKVVEVFHSYGISLAGQRKNDHIIQQLNRDPVFVNGLIFELEYNLQVFLEMELLGKACTPKEVIKVL